MGPAVFSGLPPTLKALLVPPGAAVFSAHRQPSDENLRGGVDCQLNSTKEGKPIRHDLQTPAISPTNPKTNPKCNSGRRTFVVTLPPASRQILATTLSRAYPLLPKIPAREQRGGGQTDRVGGHTGQECTDKGKGNWRRRKRRTRNCCGSNG